MRHKYQFTTWIILVSVLSGCGITDKIGETLPDNRADYKKSKTVPTLELPPDLSASTIEDQYIIPDETTAVSYSEYSRERESTPHLPISQTTRVLPQAPAVELKRDGQTRWLVIGMPAEYLWTNVVNFWESEGFALKIENPSIGVMETEWKENRADIPQDGLRKLLGNSLDMLYAASTRDKFRTRLERGQTPDITEVYLTHRGAEEVDQNETFVWQYRPSDPELEAEMLRRLIVSLGVKKETAQGLITEEQIAMPQVQLIRPESGDMTLVLNNTAETAWRRVGLALDRIGFTVEDRNRNAGEYIIYYVDPDEAGKKQGFFSKLFKGKKEEEKPLFTVRLRTVQANTEVIVLDKVGQRDNSRTVERILNLLYEQLK